MIVESLVFIVIFVLLERDLCEIVHDVESFLFQVFEREVVGVLVVRATVKLFIRKGRVVYC